MTVRVNKSSFNIREKLSELERPIGLKGSELMRAETAQEARDLVSAGRKNLIINGDMRINQRYGSASRDITNGQDEYVMDRFIFREQTSTSLRVERSTLTSISDPQGFKYAVKVSTLGTDSAIGATEYSRIQQLIETNNLKCDWGLQNTDYLTLSFWVKSSVPGKYFANLEDGDALPVYLKPYYIHQANTWQKIELTFPPPPEGLFTQSTDNDRGLRVTWILACGANWHNNNTDQWITGASYYMSDPQQVNFLNGTGNAFWLTGVQLEVGKNATEFEHRSYGEELALCQRYYQLLRSGSMLPATTNGTSQVTNIGISLAVPMRAGPTVDNAQQFVVWHGSANGSASSNQTMLINGGDGLVRIRGVVNGFSGLTDNRVANIVPNNSNIQLNAEL
jgi:hypothetical protein